jgi:serine/threonine-protein kinase RsbW
VTVPDDRWVLPVDLTAAQAARQHVADHLDRHGTPTDVVDDAVLIASELAANAVRHGAPPILLLLERTADRLRITVVNHGDAPDPRVIVADPDANHGRGLAMVSDLAAATGWERDGDRLLVWAELDLSRDR